MFFFCFIIIEGVASVKILSSFTFVTKETEDLRFLFDFRIRKIFEVQHSLLMKKNYKRKTFRSLLMTKTK
jgi:hypothetical protein